MIDPPPTLTAEQLAAMLNDPQVRKAARKIIAPAVGRGVFYGTAMIIVILFVLSLLFESYRVASPR